MPKPKTVHTLATLKNLCTECGDCWEWQGSYHLAGYPQIHHDGKQWLARRLAYVLSGKRLFERCKLHMRCENDKCINPDHMANLTIFESTKRAAKVGWSGYQTLRRKKIAETKQASGKLNHEIVAQIRDSDESAVSWAARLNVSRSLVSGVRAGTKWRETHRAAGPWDGLLG